MDIFPTILDMADIPLRKDIFLDGESIKTTLLNNSKQYDRYSFFIHTLTQYMDMKSP